MPLGHRELGEGCSGVGLCGGGWSLGVVYPYLLVLIRLEIFPNWLISSCFYHYQCLICLFGK